MTFPLSSSVSSSPLFASICHTEFQDKHLLILTHVRCTNTLGTLILASVDNALLLAPGGFLTDNGFLSPDSVITTTRPLLGDSSSSLSTTSSSSALLPSLFASHILSAIAAKSRSSKPLLLALSLPRSVSQLLQDNNNNNEINNTNTTSAMDKENEEEDAGLKGARILLDEVMQSLRAPPFLLIN